MNPLPMKATIALTFQCNSRCKICNIWRSYLDDPAKIDDEMRLDEYHQLFRELKGVLWMEFTGGEPFLREDIADVITSAFRTSAVANALITNGLLGATVVSRTEEIVKDLPPGKNFTLGVSIDGTGGTFREVRGVDGFDRAMGTFLRLRELARDYRNFTPHIAYTISRLNAGRFGEFYSRVADEHGIDIADISFTIEHHRGYYRPSGHGALAQERFSEEAKKDLRTILVLRRSGKRRQAGTNGIKERFYDYFLDNIPRFIDEPDRRILPCSAARSSAYIDPYGTVFPCTMWDRPLGNLRERTFPEIWRSDAPKEARKDISCGGCPNCWTPCEAQPSFVMRIERNIWKAVR